MTAQRYFIVALLAVFAVASVQYSHKALDGRSALVRWQPQVSQLEDGVNLAEKFNYPNPPIMALLLLPLVKLPPLVAALTWFYLKVAMTLLALYWVFRFIEGNGPAFPVWAKALTAVLSLRPILGDLQHGNVNLFILFLIVAALAAYQARRDILAGLVIALAIACKVTPALFIPYLVWKRSTRALAGVTLGLILFLWPGVVPSAYLGYSENQRQLSSWYFDMVYPFVVEGKVTSERANQSLPGLAYRMLTHSPSSSTFVDDVYIPLEYDNLLTVDPATVRWLLKGCMLVFVLTIAWTCRTPTAERSGWRIGAEMSLVVLGMLLFSERTWKHHCVTLLLPFAVICYRLAVDRPRPTVVWALSVLLAMTAGLMMTTSTVHEKGLAHMAQVYGAYTIANLLLVAALAALLRADQRAAKANATPFTPPDGCATLAA